MYIKRERERGQLLASSHRLFKSAAMSVMISLALQTEVVPNMDASWLLPTSENRFVAQISKRTGPKTEAFRKSQNRQPVSAPTFVLQANKCKQWRMSHLTLFPQERQSFHEWCSLPIILGCRAVKKDTARMQRINFT